MYENCSFQAIKKTLQPFLAMWKSCSNSKTLHLLKSSILKWYFIAAAIVSFLNSLMIIIAVFDDADDRKLKKCQWQWLWCSWWWSDVDSYLSNTCFTGSGFKSKALNFKIINHKKFIFLVCVYFLDQDRNAWHTLQIRKVSVRMWKLLWCRWISLLLPCPCECSSFHLCSVCYCFFSFFIKSKTQKNHIVNLLGT